MKRLVLLSSAIFFLTLAFAGAAIASGLYVGTGGGMVYDPANQDPASLTHVTAGYTFRPSLAAELRAMTTNSFELENDLTHEKASFNAVLFGGRFLFPEEKRSRGFVCLGLGAMEIEADGTSKTRDGFLARFAFGVDFFPTEALGITFESGFSRGMGQTAEVLLFDVIASVGYRF